MADISNLARLINGYTRNVNLTNNTLVLTSIKIGGVTNTELTKVILDKLVNLQNGTDFATGTNAHTHDGRYFTETELGSATGTSGSELIGDEDVYSNFTPTAATVAGALAGIDSALGSASDELVKISATDTTSGYLAAKIQVDIGSNTTDALEESILNPAGNEILRVRFDQGKVDHGSIAGLGDDDHTIYTKADGTRAFSGNQSFGGNRATNLADPTADQDAVTKAYLDAVNNGLKPKAAVRVAASTNVVIASALENGDAVDGITLATGDRVLLRGQTAPEENGIYVVVASGAASRSLDFDSLTPIDEINRSMIPVQEGTDAGKVFVQYGIVAVLDTDPITFTNYDPISGIVGGDMITKTGSTLSVDLLTNGGLKSSNPGNVAGQLQVSLEASNPSLEINGSNELKAKLNAAGAITSGASGLIVGVDNSTVEISSNALRVKDNGITNAKLATNAVAAGNIQTDAVVTAKIQNTAVTAAKLNSDVVDNITISGGAGAALVVQQSPAVVRNFTAGETFAANTTFAVRISVDGETAGRVMKADYDATTLNNFYVIGLVMSTSSVTAGNPIAVTMLGNLTQGSSDTAFGATDIGKPVFLTASGAWSVTAPSTANQAIVRVGIVLTTTIVLVQPSVVGIN